MTRDDGTFSCPGRQDLRRRTSTSWPRSGGEHRFTEMYERMRVRLSDKRAEIPRELPFTPPFNKWSANVPGLDVLRPGQRGHRRCT